MLRRDLWVALAAAAAVLGSLAGSARAQSTADLDAVKAANAAFYTALSARDVRKMEAVWANKPYVVNMGPRIKTFAVGYDEAVAKRRPKESRVLRTLLPGPWRGRVQRSK